ncbi:MAG: helix-turn-helix transcriptional regulator [Gemmataceae bacterium]
MEPEEIALRLANKVDELMKARGWIQADLARESGMGTGNVARLLSGKHNPTAPTLAKLATLFEVDVCDLLCPMKGKKRGK